MKKISRIKILVLTLLILSLCACQKKKEESNPSIADYPIEHEMEYGGVYIKIAIDDFNALGFSFGDSIDLTFDNGKKLEDIPYYNGYYVDAGEPFHIHTSFAYFLAGIYHDRTLVERSRYDHRRFRTTAATAPETGSDTLLVMVFEEIEHVGQDVVG